jgi:phage shock protein PspC (stress-responsive transcriptional regulator)
MNKVITINLNGNAYQLEEDGYEALRAYLESAARRLEGNPDKAEIIADIEQSIGDKFRAVLGVAKTVVVTKEVQDVIAEMGPVQDASGDDEPAAGAPGARGAPEAAAPGAAPGAPKRLYKIRDGAMIGGVCNGLAAYFGVDVTIVRIAFAFLAFMWGSGILLYFLMMIILPHAETPAEKAAAYGAPSTAEEFIKRAKAGYYGGMKTFGDKKAYREWKRQFKREMRQHKRDFQREIHENFSQWRQNWRQNWARHAHDHHDWFVGSLLSLLLALITLVGLFAVISLILTGSIFTFGLPAGMPIWVGIILLIVIFHVIKWPLRVARHAAHYHGAYGPEYHHWPGSFLVPLLWWAAVLLFITWVASHHSVKAHEVLEQVRHEAHTAVDSVRDWWNRP